MESLIKGEIYKVTDGNFWMIGKVIKPNNGDNEKNGIERGIAIYVSSIKDHFQGKFIIKEDVWCYYHPPHRKYQLATPKERYWLECCIEVNKYIPIFTNKLRL